MHVVWWSLGLFVLGLIELALDQYQKIILARLKFWPTVAFQALKELVEFLQNVWVWGTVIDFWEKIRAGVYDFKTLIPYMAYAHGCVAGTAVAMWIYIKNKKKKDREKAIKLLEKARSKKKKMNDIEVETETLFDEVEKEDMKHEIRERAIEQAADIISKQVEKAFNDNGEQERSGDTDQVSSEKPSSEIPPSGSSSGAGPTA